MIRRLCRAARSATLFAALSAAVCAATLAAVVPAQADELAGAYLAARQASVSSDYENAATYYARALAADPANPVLMENAMLAELGLGAFDRAIAIAHRLEATGTQSQYADLVMLVDELQRKAYDEVAAGYAKGRAIGPLVDGLVKAWAAVGQGQMTVALAGFDEAAKGKGLTGFAQFHKALALASAGDFEGANKILSGEAAGPLQMNRRGIVAQIEVLSQLERNAVAVELIDKAFDADQDPGMKALRDRLVAGETLPFDAVRDATEGEAEVFLTLAAALDGQAEDTDTLIYARIANYLRPGTTDAILLTADLLAKQQQFDLANRTFNLIPRDDAAFVPAELGRAEALFRSGKKDAALEVMQQLAKVHPESPVVLVNLGDMHRRLEQYADAIVAYDAAIALMGAPKPAQWAVYYARGIAFERTGAMDKAETDMRLALKLNPDQPQVLNYLGYAFVDANRNLDEALSMIQRAVAARPDDGYIIDSLAWALYRMGRAPEAVEPQEHAVELEAVDSILNDHLGDVYWAVGRKLEAEFQWRRALSFGPDAKDEARIRRKLDVGLDQVLQDEGAVPKAVTADGN